MTPLFRDMFALALMPVLAQEIPPPDPAHLSSWLVDAAALGAILLVFLKVIDHFKRRPSLEQELEKLLRQLRTELNQVRHEQTEHLAEVRAAMAAVGIKGELAFVPQSAPMVRGIFASLQFPLPPGLDLAGLQARAQDVFRDAPLVRLVADSPRVGAVAGSAFADLAVAARSGSGVVLTAIDNLGKGMAAQAVQNMNLALGLGETLGLRIPGRYPG